MPVPPGTALGSSTGTLSGTLTTAGTFSYTVTVTDSLGATMSGVFSTTVGAPASVSDVDSLIIADQIELLGGSLPSTNPACAGAVFLLQPGYDLAAPQPTTDVVGSLILDGERPFGYRASDRTITLPIMIDCRGAADGQGGFAALSGAYEVLMAAIDEQEFTLTWTRANGLPLVLDCFRAQASVVTWGGADQMNISPVGAISLTFSALPYGRSDVPVEILVASPLPGNSPPPAPQVLDDFSTIEGADNFLTGVASNFEGGVGTWVAAANTTAAVTSAQANTGLFSLGLTSVAAGNIGAVSCLAANILSQGMPVIPGSTVTASAWFLPAVNARTVSIGAGFYDATGAFLSTAQGPGILETLGTWQQATALLTVPAAAVVCRAVAVVQSTGAGSEVHYFDDPFIAVTQWQPSSVCVVGPQTANWNPCNPPVADCTGAGSQPGAVYSAPVSPAVDITGLPALSVWAGFGSAYWDTWHKGPAVFAYTLFDQAGNQLSFSRTMTVHASNDPGAPYWQRVTAVIPQGFTAFDYTTISAYTLTVTNRGYHTLRFTQLYLDDLAANPQSVQNPPSVRGAMYSVLGVNGTARTPCSAEFQQPPGTGTPVTVTLPGPSGRALQWTAPPGVASVKVECTGAGGDGGSVTTSGNCGGGGGGGGYSAGTTVAVTPGTRYTYNIGASTGGIAITRSSYFIGDAVTVDAFGGQDGATGPSGAAGAGGSGSAFTGGAGAAGSSGAHGGGGGGSAGSGSAGGAASGATGGTAGTGTTPGAAGGNGASSAGNGLNGVFPGGGGGGARAGSSAQTGGNGADGQILLTYTPANAPFSTLIAHRPGPAAPATLAPLVSFGLTDVPNGGTEYPVPSLTPTVFADFGGTYTIAAVANTWNSPGSSRTVTITVKQYEYAGGPSYSTTVARTFTPNTDTFIPGGATLAQVPVVALGELTLPLQDTAPDNISGLYTITITDTNTSDTFMDCLFLDTTGQTVSVGMPSAGAYSSFFIDQPDTSAALGRVMGSAFDRGQAISVMSNALVSGGPLFLTPGDNMLLVYAREGAPALSVTYFPRWFLGRLS